jgi:hypothetical protein
MYSSFGQKLTWWVLQIGLTADQQYEALSAFIDGMIIYDRKDNTLSSNGDRLKTSHVVDLKFAQSCFVGKRNTIEFYF